MTAAGDPLPCDRLRFTTLAHADRLILGPFDGAELESLIDSIPLPASARALDVGCGKGDLLVRLARRSATGLGIDWNPAFIERARALAADADVADRVLFVVGAAAKTPLPANLDLVACVGATGALGGPARAPSALALLARPGGVVVIGETFRRLAAGHQWLTAFGVDPEEMLDRKGTLERMTGGGLELLSATDASAASWDAYEESYAAAIERWAGENADDPEREAFLARAAFMRSSWVEWRRAAMGLVTAVLRRPVPG